MSAPHRGSHRGISVHFLTVEEVRSLLQHNEIKQADAPLHCGVIFAGTIYGRSGFIRFRMAGHAVRSPSYAGSPRTMGNAWHTMACSATRCTVSWRMATAAMAEKCCMDLHVCGYRPFAKPPRRTTWTRGWNVPWIPGAKRSAAPLLLTLISRSVLPHLFRTDFLDYCLIGMSSSRYPYSVRALCMKLAYKLCLPHPELLDELKSNLEITEPDLLPPSLRSVRCRVMVGIVSQKRRIRLLTKCQSLSIRAAHAGHSPLST